MCGDKTQNRLLIAFLIAGALLEESTALAPLHEEAHVWIAKASGVEAHVTSRTTTAIGRATPAILAAGYYGDTSSGVIVFALLLFVTSPHSTGWRKHYFYLGLPLGFAIWSWLTPLIFPVIDFTMYPEWTDGMRLAFFFDPGWAVALEIFVLWLLRLRPRKRKDD